ncbi:MAG: hypothetical protein JWM80_1379 [Cyanobacteria bacterium RYN_339]|nr:hypothetical protein [Cyanobacteria bacterium RYN_339]
MDIPVVSILQATEKTTRYSFQETIVFDDEKLLDPVVGEFEITRASNQILQVKGLFKARLQLACDRCGEPFELPVEFDVDEGLEVIDGPVTSEEVNETVSATGNFDATDLIRQNLLLALPTRRLCGCEPLTNQADADSVDPRWAALRSIHQEPNGKH